MERERVSDPVSDLGSIRIDLAAPDRSGRGLPPKGVTGRIGARIDRLVVRKVQHSGRSVILCAAISLLALALWGMRPPPVYVEPQPPILLPAVIASPEPPQDRSYASWRASHAITIATREEVLTALLEAGVPREDARLLADAVVECEAPVRQSDGTSIGAHLRAVGDHGDSLGAFQVNIKWNPQESQTYLFDLHEGAKAAARVYWKQGIGAWSCLR